MNKVTAVLVVADGYERNHGATPRGEGQWGFCTVDPRRLDYLSHVLWVSGKYGEAKRAAVKLAKSRGLDTLYVCS